MLKNTVQLLHEKHQQHPHWSVRALVVALLLFTYLWMSASHNNALRQQDDAFNNKLEEHRKQHEAEKVRFVGQLDEQEKRLKAQQLVRRQLSIKLSRQLDETQDISQLLEGERRKSKEHAEEALKVKSSLRSVKRDLSLAVPKKHDTPPSQEEINAALAVVMSMLEKQQVGSLSNTGGGVIAVVGHNIAPVVERLHNASSNVTILGGETASSSEALEDLHKRFAADAFKVFEVEEAHPVPALRAALPTDAVDTFIVWDLDNGLNAALTMKSLTFEANRILRARAGGPRSAIFVVGQKELSFGGDHMKVKDVALPPASSSHWFSVHLLERGGGAVSAKSRWNRLSGMKAVAPLEFLSKCRTPQEHMYGLDVLLRIVADALEECGITYWLDSATLLGAYRFGAYSPTAADHRVVVDSDELAENTESFRKLIAERFEEINRQPHFMALDDKQKQQQLVSRLVISKDGSAAGPQIDLIPAKWDDESSRYEIQAAHLQRQTQEGFTKKILFSNETASKWKTKHGYLRSLPILGREYPAPYDVEAYSAVWHTKSDFMNFIVLRQMRENKGGNAVYCRDSYAKVFAPKDVSAVRKMVARLKELFPVTFTAASCPLCKK